jgi:hypothetical protein
MNNKTEYAQTIALKGLHYILDDDNRQAHFFHMSGATLDELKNSIVDPDFLGGILDFLLNDEKQLISFCKDYNIDPPDLTVARRCFPGAQSDY